MSNMLYEALFAPLAGRSSTFLFTREGKEISGRDFHDLVLRFASTFATLGLKCGDRVAVQVAKSPEALALYGAAVASGIVFLPLNTAYTASEVAYFVDDSGAALLIGDDAHAATLQEVAQKARAKFLSLNADGSGTFSDEAEKESATYVPAERGPDDLAALLYTSGTTGRSKGAMLSQKNLLSNAEVLVREWRFTGEDVLLHALPIFHTHGLFVACNVVLLSRGSMIFLPSFKPDDIIRFLPMATSMMGVPTFYTRLLDDPRFDRELTQHMRLFTSGSAPLLADTHVAFEKRTGHKILERYGMTETNMSTSNPYEGERRAGTVGFPLPGIELRIVNADTNEPAADGEPGIIEVRGPNVFQGYWRMPEKTKEELREDGFFITGDIGRIDEDGYVSIVGRQKDLIITGGYNVYPKEIELVFDEQPGVMESAVIGLPHPDFGEAVACVVVPENGTSLNPSELEAIAGEKLARFKQPKVIFIVDELPRNTMGKVQKNVLRDTYHEYFREKSLI
ncbi:malonate--CoA ligase [Limoniibacter endophyticus]|uniref:Malonyl-CoA synthase n=1 Tax=Limoniibacter endophyticus TaxID=1565040 RepID=A0A8J3GJD4_9HYPH|nr:malonyl-CoA synthase [Limoniibacter endophyticus]GHC77521.1 malonyl-CoA synthase [Limoniibacter endophyticus]